MKSQRMNKGWACDFCIRITVDTVDDIYVSNSFLCTTSKAMEGVHLAKSYFSLLCSVDGSWYVCYSNPWLTFSLEYGYILSMNMFRFVNFVFFFLLEDRRRWSNSTARGRKLNYDGCKMASCPRCVAYWGPTSKNYNNNNKRNKHIKSLTFIFTAWRKNTTPL